MNLKILFFTTATEHTTFRKTARMLQKEGATVKLLGFTRNNYPASTDNISTNILGTLTHGSYIKRLFTLLKALRLLRKEAGMYDVVYCFALDTLLFARLALRFQKKTIVYQVQDIRAILIGQSLKSKLARKLEKILIKKVSRLVVSSEFYFKNHFSRYYNFPFSKTTVIENKLENPPDNCKTEIQDNKRNNNTIVVGYFGVMRCKRSWEILRDTIKTSQGNFALYLRGKPDAIPNIDGEISETPNILFKGPYKSPDDLNTIYDMVDIVWAAYPFGYGKEGNWQMARTIRFYEACAHKKPVLVQTGTPQAQFVKIHNIGLVIDMNLPAKVISQIQNITTENLLEWKKNLSVLDQSMFVHTIEYKQFLYTLLEDSKLINRRSFYEKN